MTRSVQKPVCLITGATDGVGKSTTLELAKRGFRVVMVARNASKAEALKSEIAALTGTSDVEYIVADLASLRQVRLLGEIVRERYAALDVLINNAGVFLPNRTETEDGYETTYQVNYLAHFLLTQLLLDPLRQSAQGRIINLSSSVHSIGKFDLHNGIVRTPMMMRAPGAFRLMSLLSLPFSISPKKGAQTSVYLATSPELRTSTGQYFTSSRQSRAKNPFDTEENRALLWDLSLKSIQGDSATAARREG